MSNTIFISKLKQKKSTFWEKTLKEVSGKIFSEIEKLIEKEKFLSGKYRFQLWGEKLDNGQIALTGTLDLMDSNGAHCITFEPAEHSDFIFYLFDPEDSREYIIELIKKLNSDLQEEGLFLEYEISEEELKKVEFKKETNLLKYSFEI